MSAALLAAAGGLGDILRATPLIRVLHGLGHEVDVLLAPDYAETAALLHGAPELRRVRVAQPHSAPVGLADAYELTIATHWGARIPQLRSIRSRRRLAFERNQWLREGDAVCSLRIARTLGWHGALPEPFACAPDIDFDLPPGTVALHPGCKRGWPWKKWHGFAELAAQLPRVAVIGTAEDRDVAGTYFRVPFEWPRQVRDFTGALSLAETAALLRHCVALVSNDSGLMHLGVALGVPTLGIFGLTSPAREALPAHHMHVLTKGLPCEPRCRLQPWGRRDCEHHLRCLRELGAQEVLERLSQLLAVAPAAVMTEPV